MISSEEQKCLLSSGTLLLTAQEHQPCPVQLLSDLYQASAEQCVDGMPIDKGEQCARQTENNHLSCENFLLLTSDKFYISKVL